MKSTGQVFCIMSFYWDLTYVFLTIRLGLWVLQRKITKVKCNFRILSKIHTINVTYQSGCWPWSADQGNVCFVNFLHCTGTLFFLLSIWYSLKGSHTFTIYWPNLMSGELHSTFLREVYLHKLLRIPLHRKFASSSPFIIYSIIYLCHYGLMDTYFIIWLMMQ